ncbi:MAG: hypothetical protein KJN97_01840 [Deltaproteobacteria bacterium]|nr:hypothetical protein [Deltaproteobacteria bacterium]
MKKIYRATLPRCTALILVSVLGLLSGCLYMGDPGHVRVDPSKAASMEGVEVELIRHSTRCDSAESQGLIVEVGPWVEYPAEVVRALKGNCALAHSPGIEVHIENDAVVFDFSNVEGPGRFHDGEFEGYILEFVRVADAPVLVAALVDSKTSTIQIFEDDLSFDQDRLQVNLAGQSFASSSLLRINLYLTELSDPAHSGIADPM